MGTFPQYEAVTNEAQFQQLIAQAPVIIATFKGPSYKVTAINNLALQVWGKSIEQVIDKPLFDAAPEMEAQLKEIFNDMFVSGEPFIANEMPFKFKRIGKPDKAFFNIICQPYSDTDNKIEGISVIGTEVTELILSRNKLEKSELLSRTILESTPDCLKVLDLEGRIVYMNFNGLCQMEIDDFSTFKNKKWSTLWGEHEALANASLNQALKGNIAQFSAICPTAKGTMKWWDVLVSPVKTPDGLVQQIIAVSRDITEQKIAQNSLDKMASHLKLATDSANVGVWSLCIQTQQLEWSALHKKMWGYDDKRTDLVYKDWHSLILPGDKELALKKLEDARINHTFYEVVYRIKRANDEAIRWMKAVGQFYYNKEGEAETLTGISLDITEQKNFTEALEQKVAERTKELSIKNKTFELAEKNAKFGSYKWNMKTGALEYSDNLFRLLDCDPNEFEPSYEKFMSFIHPDDVEHATKNGEETLKTGVLVETPYRIISKTGKIKHFRSSGSFTMAGEEHTLIGTVQDVTSDVKAADELKAKNIELELINAELASFNYIASHDLQEPLRKIQTFSSYILETEQFSETTEDYFNRIIEAGKRMQKLIVSLLSFSRTSAAELVLAPCNLNQIVEEAKDNLHLSIVEKQAVVEYENLPTINGADIYLTQVFTNLIDNSIKYSLPERKPHIVITSSTIDGKKINHPSTNHQKKYFKIQIADNGIGFKKEYQTKIFEVFQRLHTKTEYSGTGIGLAIVKKIISNHKGFITAEGTPNVGATFTIYLPTA